MLNYIDTKVCHLTNDISINRVDGNGRVVEDVLDHVTFMFPDIGKNNLLSLKSGVLPLHQSGIWCAG